MPLTVQQAVDAHLALSALIGDDRANKCVLPSAVRIRLAGSLRKTKPVFEDYAKEQTALMQKYGKLNKEGELVVAVSSENYVAFQEEIAKIRAEATEIEGFSKVTKEELFGKELVDSKTKESRPDNQIDINCISGLIEAGILDE